MTRIRHMYVWFVEGLCWFLPAFLKQACGMAKEIQVVECHGTRITIWRFSETGAQAFATLRLDTQQKQQCLASLQAAGAPPRERLFRILILPPDLLLRKQFSFPDMPARDLREALAHELPKRTPFSPEQALYGHRASRNPSSETQDVTLFVTPRKKADPLLLQLEELGLTCDAVVPDEEARDALDVNLLPETRADGQHSVNFPALCLFCLAAALLILNLHHPLWQQKKEITRMEALVSAERGTLIRLQELRTEQGILHNRNHFLAERTKPGISGIDVLQAVTRLLPDDTWLERLEMRTDKVVLEGQSRNAGELIQLMEASPWFSDAQYENAIFQNQSSGHDQFTLSVKMETPQP